MPVVRIWVVRMNVTERFMPVQMGMPDIGRRRFGMLVAVLQNLVRVQVFMALGQVRPHTHAHQRG